MKWNSSRQRIRRERTLRLISDFEQNTQSKTAGPNRPAVFIVVLIILFLLLGSISYLIYQLFAPQERVRYACIYSDGELLQTIDLMALNDFSLTVGTDDSSHSICITNHEGHQNIITITPDGGICVSEADCPNQLCVNRGIVNVLSNDATASDTLPIVCLPNHLVITFEKTPVGSPSSPDSITY